MAFSPKRASFYADLDLLRTHFEALDRQKTGYIGYGELTQLVRDMPTFEESMVPELMERLDRDKDGRISFEDFKVLFEQEREAAKHANGRQRLGSSPAHFSTPNQTHYDTAFESIPSEIIVSPTDSISSEKRGDFPDSTPVILRHKHIGRRSLPANYRREQKTPDFLSPIQPDKTPSGEMPDLATQMRHLTTAESPQLNRNSKVLSWISESEDLLFEDTGTGSGEEQGASTPPMSPTRDGSDEASHVRSILEGVCHSKEIGRDAIAKICSHVQADPQEEQALLSMLDQLDQKRQGWVPLDDFVRGLQGVRNTSIASSTPPTRLLARRRYSDMPLPKLSEPFDTPLPSKEPPLASTPLPASAVADERAILSVLDPEHSGYVKVDSLVSNLQKMGVEAPHNQSLEEVLAEAIPMDPTGRVNVSELTASLEGAMLSEGKAQSVLRQVALKSFKNEISLLRSQMNQVSLERDTLKTSLVRTQEENKKLVIEGDEHVDRVAKQSQRIIKEQETRHSVRLREVERSRLEEAQVLQETATQQVAKLEQSLKSLKVEEEKLRADFKYAQDEVQEVTEKLSHAHRELSQKDRIIRSLHKDLSIRSDQGYGDDIESQLSRISELENEISERTEQNQELAEKTRELQDKVDLLMADNEVWKQKYTAQKRKLQRRRSSGSLKQSDHQARSRRRRLSSGSERQSIPQRPRSAGFRAPSNTPRRPSTCRSRTPPPILEDLEELDIPEDPNSQNSEPDSPLLPAEVESNFLPGDTESSESTEELASSSDDLFARSTASLMEELQQEEHRTMLQRRIDQLRRDKEQLELDCQELEQQLRSLGEGKQPAQRNDLHKELKSKRKKQAEIEKHIANLDKQRKRLSASRVEIDSQIANAEDSIAKQLEEIQSLKKLLVVSSDLESSSDIKLDHLVEELEETKSQMMENQSSHKETVEKLLLEIKALEEEKTVHLDHSQKVDREHSQLQEQVSSLQDKLQSERAIHEEEVNHFKKQLQDSQNLLSEAKDRYDTELSKAKKELESAQMELTQYREDADSLRNKLDEAQVALEGSLARRHETAELQAMPPSDSPERSVAAEIAMLTATLEHSQGEIARYSEMNDHLQKQLQLCQATATATKDKAEEEVARLQSQLIAAHNEISDQATLYEEEISQLKEDHKKQSDKNKKLAEIRLAEAKVEYEKAARSIKRRGELQIEAVKQQLKGSELRMKELQEQLLMTEGQCEDVRTELSQLREREVQTRQQIMEYQANEERYKSDMSQLKIDAEQYCDELASLKVKEEQYRSQAAVLAEELQKRAAQKSPVEAIAVDETDLLEMSPPHRPSSRSSYMSDTSMHEETIAQMKSQLEDLQRMLVVPGKFSEEEGNEELSLLQKLIANNNTLQNDMQKAKLKFQSEQQGYLGQIEATKQELKASELTIRALQEKLSITKIQSEKALVEANQLRDRETHHQQQILEYQASEKKYRSEMSQLKTVAEKYKDELAALKDKEQQYQNRIAILAEELQCMAIQESPVTPPYSPTSRSAYKFDISMHEEMVKQMKSQLEDLQRMLNTRGESSYEEGGSEELSLIQELLANNSALQSDMQKVQQNFLSEQQTHLSRIALQEEELEHLKSEISRQKHAESPVTESTDGSRYTKEAQVEQEMDSLQKELKVKSSTSPAIEAAVAITATDLEAQIFHSAAQANTEGKVATTQTESKAVIQRDEIQLKEEIQALKDEIEQRKVSEKKTQSSLEDMEAELHSLRSELAHWQAEATTRTPSKATGTPASKEREILLRDRAIKRKDEEINTLKEDLERMKLSNKEAQNVKVSAAAEVKKLQDKLREEEAITATLRAEINKKIDKPAVEDSAKAKEKALSGKLQLEIEQRDEIIARKNEEIRRMKAEIEEANASMTESIHAQELAETELKRKHSELQRQECKLSTYDQQIKELQHRLDAVVREPIEAVIQYVESAPLESVNEAVLVELQRDVQAEKAKVRNLQTLQPNAQQLQTSPKEAVPDLPQQLEVLRTSVQQAEEELKASQAAHEDLRQKQVQLLKELKEEHAQKLSAAQLVSEAQTEELRGLHASLIALPGEGRYKQQLDHSTMVQEIKSEVESLKAQLHHVQVASAELEKTFSQKMQEYDQQELQFHTEHEEEVRALHQQKQQLAKQIEDLKQHYHRLLNDQDNQNTVLLEDLVSRKAQLEDQLQQKADDHFRSYQQIADLLEEKKVLMSIIRQLCIEAGKEIEVG